mgnify:CR=1 FL=1|jgi:phosphotransferase system enzyme I (PtsI)
MIFQGISAFAGREIGTVLRINNALKVDADEKSHHGLNQELDTWNNTVAAVLNDMEAERKQFLKEKQETKADIVDIQITLLKDRVFQDKVRFFLDHGYSAPASITRAVTWEKNSLLKVKNNYLRERTKDIEDMGNRLVSWLAGYRNVKLPGVGGGTIIVTEDIFPSLLMEIKQGSINGIILQQGSATSHAVILAGSMGIPTLIQCKAAKDLKDGDVVYLNATSGYVEGPLSPERKDSMHAQLVFYHRRETDLSNSRMLPAETADKQRIRIMANITDVAAGEKSLQMGADGVGLFRTEFFFMNRSDLPSEQEQFECYCDVAGKLNGKPLTIRTIDIGADKRIDSLKLEKEQNPFLGYRAIRICADHEELFLTQLRACLRASAFGKICIMFPMISSLQELHMAKQAVQKAKRQLQMAGQAYDENIKVGMMVEIPSAALMAERFAEEVDFFSIGSNDLTQYTLAVDRLNSKISYLYDPLNPAVLKLIAKTIHAALKTKIVCSLCGEMAADPLAIPLLLGFGLRYFSMNMEKIPLTKKLISLLNVDRMEPLSNECLKAEDSDEIRKKLKTFLGDGYWEWIS